MKATGLEKIRSIKDHVNASDVPPWAEIIEPHGRGFLCRINEVPDYMKPTLPEEYCTVEKIGEREAEGGSYTYPVLRKSWDVPDLVWKLEPRPNGSATWNRHWDTTEEEKAERARREKRDQVLDLVADRLAGAPDPEEIIDRMLGEADIEPQPLAEDAKEGAPVAVHESGIEARMESPGRWTLPTGDVVRGSKEDALAALDELAGES